MKWILLIWIYAYGPTGATSSAEFDTKDACEAAAAGLRTAIERGKFGFAGPPAVFHVCAPSR